MPLAPDPADKAIDTFQGHRDGYAADPLAAIIERYHPDRPAHLRMGSNLGAGQPALLVAEVLRLRAYISGHGLDLP